MTQLAPQSAGFQNPPDEAPQVPQDSPAATDAGPAAFPADLRKRPSLPVALVLAARPRQWVKNVLV
ncbi:MAG: hypothetical protein HOW97_03855, partial [Catenulispora sp.]|nr:hypothetical protein [Catenulispora sp.]